MRSSDDTRCLGVGILGCSDIARRKFIPAVLCSKLARLSAIYGRDSGTAAALVPDLRCDFMDCDELLASRHIQVIYNSLPNHLHEEFTIRALEQGKHVICEKPLGLSTASVERMLQCAEANGLLLYENLMFLCHPQHDMVKNLLQFGKIGRLVSLRSVFGFPAPATGNFRLDPAMGGGALNDLSRYPAATALYFLRGALDGFSGIALNRNGLNLAVHGTAVSTANEIYMFSMVFGQQYESYYEIVGETGKIRVDRAYTTPADLANVVILVHGAEETTIAAPAADHFLLALEHACSLILAGGPFQEIHDRSRTIAAISDRISKGCRDVEL
ncbi:putative oxidoreductase [Geobacter sp. OR-1]|uniref:Gfo/Idh/MocA family protein n=1 Tax=Geobacter sp. OR-1 TaxID=1266765 RepID=UPI000542B521|nr:Gfo/Idh/MocA family oxidoreductase [Geobacter sp. OR-1]GAM09066.1 putative oxidoreductase [Geobacter sp. OR-1]